MIEGYTGLFVPLFVCLLVCQALQQMSLIHCQHPTLSKLISCHEAEAYRS